LDFQAELAEAGMPLPIIFITGHGDIPMTVRAMKAGAVEFLTKPLREQDLLDAVRLGLDRDSARRDRDKVLGKLASAYQTLTRREREVFPLVTSGFMNKQVAASSVSPRSRSRFIAATSCRKWGRSRMLTL
jgi:FixJ family two-component response regulator